MNKFLTLKNSLIVLILFLSSCVKIQAQAEWNYRFQDSSAGEATALIQTGDNTITWTGYVQKEDKDIIIHSLTQDGKPAKFHYESNKKGNDVAHVLLQTFDGGILVAGYATGSENHNFKGRNSYIAKVDKGGQVLWEQYFGSTNGEDEWFDAAELPNGSIVLGGKSNGRSFIARFTAAGKNEGSLFLEKDKKGTIKNIAFDLEDKLAITGENEEGIYFAMVDSSLKLQKSLVTYSAYRRCTDLIANFTRKETSYLVLANPEINTVGQGYVLDINQSGKSKKVGTFPKRKFETYLTGLVKEPNGDIIAGGYTNFYEGREIDYDPVVFRQVGKKYIEVNLGKKTGTPGADIIRSVFLQDDGSLILSGKSPASVKLAQNPWLLKLPAALPKSAFYPDSVEVSSFQFKDAGRPFPNDTLNSQERAFLSFQLNNQSYTAYHGLKVQIQVSGNQSDAIDFPKEYIIGNLPTNRLKTFGFPFHGKEKLNKGVVEVQINILTQTGQLLKSLKEEIKTAKSPLPKLEILGGFFTTPGDSLCGREEDIKLTVLVKNKGKGIAEKVRMNFSLPYLVQFSDKNKETIQAELLPNDTVSFTCTFRATHLYREDLLRISCLTKEAGLSQTQSFRSFPLEIRHFTDVKVDGIFLSGDKEVKEWFERDNGPHFSGEPAEIVETDGIKWIFSVVDEEKQDSVYQRAVKYGLDELRRSEWTIMALVKLADTTTILAKDAIEVYQNGELLKFTEENNEEVILKNHGGGYYRYFRKIHLRSGIDKYRFSYKNAKSKSVKITFTPPDIYLYSIGINHADLKYAEQDALKFKAAIEKSYAGRTKNLCRNELHITEEKTTIANLLNLFKSGNFSKIPNHAVVMVYISSHGLLEMDDLTILSSDKAPFNISNITKLLSYINCQSSFLFIDACFSGQLPDNSQKDTTVSKTDSGYLLGSPYPDNLYVFASSQKDQKSYEYTSEGVSIFTKALLEAFDCSAENSVNICGKNNRLSVAELDRYLKRRVPELIKLYKNQLSEDYPKEKIVQSPISNISTKDHTTVYYDYSK